MAVAIIAISLNGGISLTAECHHIMALVAADDGLTTRRHASEQATCSSPVLPCWYWCHTDARQLSARMIETIEKFARSLPCRLFHFIDLLLALLAHELSRRRSWRYWRLSTALAISATMKDSKLITAVRYENGIEPLHSLRSVIIASSIFRRGVEIIDVRLFISWHSIELLYYDRIFSRTMKLAPMEIILRAASILLNKASWWYYPCELIVARDVAISLEQGDMY